MRARPNPVEALATLARLSDESERRASWRQAVAALGYSTQGAGPPPLDGITPEVLTRAARVALETGLVDDLEFVAPGPAAVALYEMSAALPLGRERRELGRRVFARLYEGTAATFATVAARMALSSGKPFEAAPLRARVGLVFDLPIGCGVNADPLALTLVTRREMRERWLDRARTGPLPVRRLAAKLLEHAAREAVFRAQQGDLFPRDQLLSDPIRSIGEALLHDREPLVWRHAAVARGILSSIQPSLREEIDVALDPNLSPTEWRRAGVSLVATLLSEPEGSLRALKQLLDGPVSVADPGLAASLVMGLPRVVEAEPDAAENFLDMLCARRRADVAEAAAALFADLSSPSFGQRAAKILKQTLLQRKDSQSAVLRSVAERAARILDRDQDDQSEVVASVRRALLAYESKGARAATDLAIQAVQTAHRAMDFVASHDAHDEQMLPYVLGALSDLDAAALESPRLTDLMLLGRRPGDTDTSVPEVERLHDRLGSFLLDAETSVTETAPSPALALGEQRRLKALLHLIDLEAARSVDDEGGVRKRVRRAVGVMMRRVSQDPEPVVHRIACATLARSFDAAVREGVSDPSDLLLSLAAHVDGLSSLEAVAEASTNPEVRSAVTGYVEFLNPANAEAADGGNESHHFELGMGLGLQSEARKSAQRLLRLSRSLGAGGSYRGEALRRVVQRLARSLESVSAARGQSDLVDASGGSADVMSDVEIAVDGLRRLTQGALRRVLDVDPMAIAVTADVPSVAALVERTVRSKVPPNAAQLQMAVTELTADIPQPIGAAIAKVLSRLETLPVTVITTTEAAQPIPLERRRSPLPDWLLPRRTIGAFYVVRSLGSGGASSVFMARRMEERNNAKAEGFALKVPDYDPTTARSLSEQEFLQLFREEAGALLGLPQHENLARFVTFDLAARPKPILVMELIRGAGLDRLIRSRSLTAPSALKYLDGILAALEAMHGAGVGHLDIKPSNVILRDGETPVLVDFGLSGRQLRPGCGTLEYCAPEVLGLVEAKSPQPADMYAFACTAFEALTFELLFDAEDETSILAAHVAHDGWPDKLARLAHIADSAELARLLAACLRREPKNRPTASQARRALRDLTPKLSSVSFPLGAPSSSPGSSTVAVPSAGIEQVAPRAESA
ncbi:MAG: serine/threonine protein kinase [Myxococcales bacterium]|nr:MAG: serine/threonine protein kinase [Myxococcales bacterium]